MANLTSIKNRYLIGTYINHFWDCRIYSNQHFCSCGLLHDLEQLDDHFAEILFDKYKHDLHWQETGSKEKNLEEEKKCLKLLESIFGPVKKESIECINHDYEYMKSKLVEFFPTYQEAFARLNLWHEKSISDATNNIH